MPALVNQQEAARLLCVSPRTLERWRVVGGGPAFIKVGSLVRYDPLVLGNWCGDRTLMSTSDEVRG